MPKAKTEANKENKENAPKVQETKLEVGKDDDDSGEDSESSDDDEENKDQTKPVLNCNCVV